jgi:hypothetical protein
MKLLDTSKPTANRAIEALAEIDILVETTGKKRDSSFAYRGYIGKDLRVWLCEGSRMTAAWEDDATSTGPGPV